jgi:hypothetical protein
VPAHASLFYKGKLCGYYTVEDISTGGCSLSGGTSLPSMAHVDLLLHLPHRPPFTLSATVQRSGGAQLGLKFQHASPRAEEAIQDLVVETFTHDAAEKGFVALVVAARHLERKTMVQTLRELGRHAIGVATALDAVQLLVQEGEHVDTVFVEAASASLPSFELVEFLAHNHPRVRRVLIGQANELSASWVAQATGEVHALLETPCDMEAVHRVLHRLQFAPRDAGAPEALGAIASI